MKNLFLYIIIIPILSIFFIGCDNFDELNTDPNSTTTVSASLLCTNAILSMAEYTDEDKAYISENALAKYVGYANEGQLETQYNYLDHTSYDLMEILPDLDKLVEYADETDASDSYKAIAKFVRAYLFYSITMKLGDIPYSEAGQGESSNYTPSYDLQEDVFAGILTELEEANDYFKSGKEFSGDPTPYDGDAEKWQRAVNSFELKVLMTLSNKVEDTSIDVVNRFVNIVNNKPLLEESTGYWGLEYSSTDLYPLSSTSSLFTGRTLISSTLMDNLKNFNDRRLYYFAEPTDVQTDAGYSENDPDAYTGLDVSIAYETMNAGYSEGLYSILNLRYQEEDACEPRRLITYAEQQLILAEAKILGWINDGSAREYYQEGVTSALEDMQEANTDYAHNMPITDSYIDSYFTGEAAFKSSEEDQLKQIWMQKYFLHFMQDPLSSYYEYRRNSYPEFPINSESSLNTNDLDAIPIRWLYPASETSYNLDNLQEALERQYDGYDEINKLMWLLK